MSMTAIVTARPKVLIVSAIAARPRHALTRIIEPKNHVRTSLALVPQMGDPAVGKSALTQMFQSGGQRFPKAYNMTCGVEFCVKATAVEGTDEAVELHLFDTAGQDVFAEIMPQYWEGAKGVILVYDVTRAHTLEACSIWYRRLLDETGGESLPGVLVANKMDLRERTCVSRQDGQQMAQNLGMHFFEASALDGVGIDDPFACIGKLTRDLRPEA